MSPEELTRPLTEIEKARLLTAAKAGLTAAGELLLRRALFQLDQIPASIRQAEADRDTHWAGELLRGVEAIAQARAEMKERCASVAAKFSNQTVCQGIAAAIRALE